MISSGIVRMQRSKVATCKPFRKKEWSSDAELASIRVDTYLQDVFGSCDAITARSMPDHPHRLRTVWSCCWHTNKRFAPPHDESHMVIDCTLDILQHFYCVNTNKEEKTLLKFLDL